MLRSISFDTPSERGPLFHSTASAGLLITACWLAMIWLVDPRGDFPVNDEWVYALAVKSILDTGFYQFPSPSSANVGPQVYWGALFCLPFGFSFTALRVSGLVAGLAGVLALYVLVRLSNGTRGSACFASLLLAVNPLYFSQSNTFMTDVPFVASALVAMCLFVTGLRRNAWPWLAAGIAVASATILIRQFGIVLLFGYVVADLAKNDWQRKRVARGIALIAFGLMLHFAYQTWLLKTGRAPSLTVHADLLGLMPTARHLENKWKTVLSVFLYAGFFLAPLMVRWWFQRGTDRSTSRPSRPTLLLLAGSMLFAFVLLLVTRKPLPTWGNVLIPSGIGPLLLFDTEIRGVNLPILPFVAKLGWAAATLVSMASLLTLLVCLAGPVKRLFVAMWMRRDLSRDWLLVFFAATALAYLFMLLMIAGPVFIYDRYQLLLLPLLMLMVHCTSVADVGRIPRRAEAGAAGLLGLLLAFSVCATHDFMAWSRARWVLLRDLTANAAVSPQQIDGGYEFNGWHLWHLPESINDVPESESWWWVVDNEYVIASGPLPGYVEVQRASFPRWLFLTRSHVLTLRRADEGQPAAVEPP